MDQTSAGRRALLASLIGSAIEWYDYVLHGTVASLVFAKRYQIGAAVAGGTAPLVATALMKRFDGAWAPVATYVVATGAVSLLAVLFARPRAAAAAPGSPAIGA